MPIEYVRQPIIPTDEEGKTIYLADELDKISLALGNLEVDNLSPEAQIELNLIIKEIAGGEGYVFPPGTRGQQLVRNSEAFNDVKFVDRDVWTFIQPTQPYDEESLVGDYWVVTDGTLVGDGYAEVLLSGSFDAYTGFVSTSGMFVTDTTGQRIIASVRGERIIQTSADGGATWTEPYDVFPGTDRVITQLQYVPEDDSWWMQFYRSAISSPTGRNPLIAKSIDDGATWTTVTSTSNGYSYGLYIHTDGRLVYGGRSSSEAQLMWKENINDNIGFSYYDSDYSSISPYGGAGDSTWTFEYIGAIDGADQFLCGWGAEGSDRTGLALIPGGVGGAVWFDRDGTVNITDSRQIATNRNGTALVDSTDVAELAVGVATYAKIELPFVTAPFPEVSINFGVPVKTPKPIYAEGPDWYVCFAYGVDDSQELYVAYTEANGNLENWTVLPPIRLTYGASDTATTNAVWVKDNTYYVSYLKEVDTTNSEFFVLEKVVLFANPPSPSSALVLSQSGFEDTRPELMEIGGDFNDPLNNSNGRDHFWLGTDNPRFGTQDAYSSYPAEPNGGYMSASSNYVEPLDPNSFTVDISINITDNVTNDAGSGVWRYGSGASFQHHAQIWYNNNNALIARRYDSNPDWYLYGPILELGTWYDIRLEVDHYRASLYVDGVRVDSITYNDTGWDAADAAYVSAARAGSTGNDSTFITGRHKVDNYRVSNGTYDSGDSYVVERFTPPVPVVFGPPSNSPINPEAILDFKVRMGPDDWRSLLDTTEGKLPDGLEGQRLTISDETTQEKVWVTRDNKLYVQADQPIDDLIVGDQWLEEYT